MLYIGYGGSVYGERCDLQNAGSKSDDHGTHQERGARGDSCGSIMVPVAVGAVRSVTVVREAALELDASVGHVSFVTEGLVRAGLHHRVCGTRGAKTGQKRQ